MINTSSLTGICTLICILISTTNSFHHMCKNALSVAAVKHHQQISSLYMNIAPYKKARKGNVDGNFYIDESCIDCDICRWMCPGSFSRRGIGSIVHQQPVSEMDRLQACAAMVTCPTGSIRTYAPDPLAKIATKAFPAAIDSAKIPGVSHCGYSIAEAFGSVSYFISRTQEEGGNVMIDCPRYNSVLAKTIEEEGGLDMLIITHRDNIHDHEKWKKRFPLLQRVIHRSDAIDTARDCEVQLEGGGLWAPCPDLSIIHTPGHTAGSLSILFKSSVESVLFTGDHLAYSATQSRLDGFKRFNHGNVEVQSEYIRLLAADEYSFQWLLPSHGRMVRFNSIAEKARRIAEAADEFDSEDATEGMLSINH